MKRHQHRVLAVVSLAAGLWVAAPARAASLTQVSRATWGATGVPSYVNMYIYVPDKLATKPPIVVAYHSCGTAVSGYISSISGIQAAADRNGFILILPEATNRNCWDVGSTASLTHDGGGDTQAVAQMVKYALTKYSGDASRVYAMGGSSGAMMTQALMAVYPDIFKAGSARAGVPAGCWADGYDPTQQWSDNCAGGRTNKTAQQWGDLVRGMYRTYTGPRRRIQLFHGTADTTINYNNMAEAIEEWTNVLALSMTPTSTDMLRTTSSNYTRQFWKNACGFTVFETWAGRTARTRCPTSKTPSWASSVSTRFVRSIRRRPLVRVTAASAARAARVARTGGTTGAGGGGGGGARDGGVDGGNDAGAGTAGRGGAQGGGGISGSSGAAGTGGRAATGGAGGTATGGRGVAGRGGGAGSTGVAGTGGSVAIGGRGGASTGGVSGGAGAVAPGGSSGGGAAGSGGGDPPDAGCGGCVIASDAGHPTPTLAALLVTALGLVLRRRRRQRP